MADNTNPIASNPANSTEQISSDSSTSTPNTALEWEIVLPNINLDNAKPAEPIILPDISLQNTYNPPVQEELNTTSATQTEVIPSEQAVGTSEVVSSEMPIAAQTESSIATEQQIVADSTTQSDANATIEPVTNTETATPENNIAPVETTVPAENVLNQENSGNDDPFDGLNIVFNQPTTPQTSVATQNTWSETVATQTTSEPKAFVDPFLNSNTKNPDTGATTQVSLDAMESTPQETTNTNATNLDSLLTTINTPPAATTTADGLVWKKKKMLVAASGLIGVAVLVAASYLVFTTMYPQETDNLAKNLQGNVAGTDTTTTTPTEQPAQGDITSAPEPTPTEKPKKEPEEELPTPAPDPVDTSANQFGQDDELPNTAPGDTTTATTPTETKPAKPEETTPTDIAPEITDALKTIEGYVDKCKQLLALAKEKNDTASIRAIAGVLKSVKEIQRKINEKTYTTYSTDIEKPLSELNFNLDQITAKLISK